MSIEKDKKPIESANRLTGSVAIRIEQVSDDYLTGI